MGVQMEEEMRAIRALSFVTKLSRVDAHNDKTAGFGVSLSCYSCMNMTDVDSGKSNQLNSRMSAQLRCACLGWRERERELLHELLPLFRFAVVVLGAREREGGRARESDRERVRKRARESERERARKSEREQERERERCRLQTDCRLH
jgi:hypothetical protein